MHRSDRSAQEFIESPFAARLPGRSNVPSHSFSPDGESGGPPHLKYMYMKRLRTLTREPLASHSSVPIWESPISWRQSAFSASIPSPSSQG